VDVRVAESGAGHLDQDLAGADLGNLGVDDRDSSVLN